MAGIEKMQSGGEYFFGWQWVSSEKLVRNHSQNPKIWSLGGCTQ
jgi:hypothetical protein